MIGGLGRSGEIFQGEYGRFGISILFLVSATLSMLLQCKPLNNCGIDTESDTITATIFKAAI